MISRRDCICGRGGVCTVGASVGLVVGSLVVQSLSVLGSGSGPGRGDACSYGIPDVPAGVEIFGHSVVGISVPSFLRLPSSILATSFFEGLETRLMVWRACQLLSVSK